MENKQQSADTFRSLAAGEEPCIWMEARVIDYKLCTHNFDCHSCPFDRAMRETARKNVEARQQGVPLRGKKGSIVPWQEKMKKRSGLSRECRHSLTGRAPFRLCAYDFECSTCQFDQMLEDGWDLLQPPPVTNIAKVEGYGLPEGHFFHLGHTWARVERGGRVRIGLDDFTMKIFGPVDTIDLPLTGERLKFSDAGLGFRRGGNQAAVLAPLTGVVAAVNAKAARNPTTVKEQPYNQGWLLVLEPENLRDDLGNLLYGTEAQQWLSAEHQGLVEMVSGVGLTYADGGAVDDVFGRVPGISWDELRQRFLRT